MAHLHIENESKVGRSELCSHFLDPSSPLHLLIVFQNPSLASLNLVLSFLTSWSWIVQRDNQFYSSYGHWSKHCLLSLSCSSLTWGCSVRGGWKAWCRLLWNRYDTLEQVYCGVFQYTNGHVPLYPSILTVRVLVCCSMF